MKVFFLIFALLSSNYFGTNKLLANKFFNLRDRRESIKLVRDLTIGNKNDNVIFGGRGLHVAVNKSGQIFTADSQNNKIWLFDQNGKLIRTIGKTGRGPGEFIHISDFNLNKNGQPVVLDNRLQKIIIFSSSDYSLKQTIILDQTMADHVLFTVYPLNVSTKSFLFGYTPIFGRQKNISENKLYVKFKGIKLSKENTILKVKSREIGLNRRNGHTSIRVLQFGRNSITHVGFKDNIFTGWNNKLEINEYSLKGNKIRTIKQNVKKIPIKKRDINSDYGKPKHKYFPAFDWFVVDNQSRVWVAVNTESRKNYTVYIFTKKGKLVSKPLLPKTVELKTVKDGYAYGVQTSKKGEKSVVRYKIKGWK